MTAETDITVLVRSLNPGVRHGEFVYVVVDDAHADTLDYEARVHEVEGVSLVMRREDADAAGLPYDFVAAWITLAVHSSLAAVGLTAALTTALAERRISCNVIAGYHHDHLLVPLHRADDALVVLRKLSSR